MIGSIPDRYRVEAPERLEPEREGSADRGFRPGNEAEGLEVAGEIYRRSDRPEGLGKEAKSPEWGSPGSGEG